MKAVAKCGLGMALIGGQLLLLGGYYGSAVSLSLFTNLGSVRLR